MSQYSETIGSFTRTGNYPLEANYIFQSEEELKQFYSDPIQKATLHEGLFKIVKTENEQFLYWVVNGENGLEFKKLDINDVVYVGELVDDNITAISDTIPANVAKLLEDVEEIKKKYGASLSSSAEGISLLSSSGEVLSTVPGGGGGSVDQSSVIRLMYGQDFSNDFNNDFNT